MIVAQRSNEVFENHTTDRCVCTELEGVSSQSEVVRHSILDQFVSLCLCSNTPAYTAENDRLIIPEVAASSDVWAAFIAAGLGSVERDMLILFDIVANCKQ